MWMFKLYFFYYLYVKQKLYYILLCLLWCPKIDIYKLNLLDLQAHLILYIVSLINLIYKFQFLGTLISIIKYNISFVEHESNRRNISNICITNTAPFRLLKNKFTPWTPATSQFFQRICPKKSIVLKTQIISKNPICP